LPRTPAATRAPPPPRARPPPPAPAATTSPTHRAPRLHLVARSRPTAPHRAPARLLFWMHSSNLGQLIDPREPNICQHLAVTFALRRSSVLGPHTPPARNEARIAAAECQSCHLPRAHLPPMLRTHLLPEAWRRPLPQEAGARHQSPRISFHRAAPRSGIHGDQLRCGGPELRWLL
jgi:hypothetical protein